MDIVDAVVLVAAALTVGLMAGVFAIYANAIMPGLRSTDDRTFVSAFGSIDRAIINPLFMAVFLGAALTSALGVVLHLGDDERSVLWWTVAAFVLYVLAVACTVAINVPMNDRLKAAGGPAEVVDPSDVRRQFDEGRWVRWNLARTIMSVAAFVCLLCALLERGDVG